jgi:cell division protein FtsW
MLTLATAALVVLGVIMVLSASSVSSFATYGSSFFFFNKQLIWAATGVVAFAFFAQRDYRKLFGYGYLGYAVVVALLLAVLVPGVGITVSGSSRWLGVGSFTFQPSEFAKLALILFVADVMARKPESSMREFSHTAIPVVPALVIFVLLIMAQPDMGTTMVLCAIGVGLLFVAGAPLVNLFPIGVVGAAGALLLALIEPYRRDRLLAFMHPWSDRLHSGYQTIQSLIAMGSGGLFGVGLGASRQKWSYLPNSHTDFIFAILGEELGLVGTIAVLGMFVFLTYLGIRAARKAPDRFGMLIAAGVTIWISIEALINMGAVTASLPITGVPLPLVSFGGSSLVVTLAAMGILTNVARAGERGSPAPARKRRKTRSSRRRRR